jgi:hypothetical protein
MSPQGCRNPARGSGALHSIKRVMACKDLAQLWSPIETSAPERGAGYVALSLSARFRMVAAEHLTS